MSYAVKEIFLTICGEGVNTGRVAVFCRFAGCNLGYSVCPWCDTDWVGTDGVKGGRYELDELAHAIASLWPDANPSRSGALVVFTGGEPLLQLDRHLVATMHSLYFRIAIETNGTLELPDGLDGLDWVCVSPKAGTELVVRSGDELKLVFPQQGAEPGRYEGLDFRHFYLQPMDGPLGESHAKSAVDYCLTHPRWRLSLQIHKTLGLR